MTCRLSTSLLLATAFAVLAGCDNSQPASTATAAAAGATAASLTLSALPTTVPSDDSLTTTVTVTALSATNAVVPDVVVTLGADTGVVGAQAVTTGADGRGTFTFRSGTGNLANRTATVTASAVAATAQIPIQISGSTLTVLSATGATVPDDGSQPVTITFVARNALGTGVAGTPISVAATGSGLVTLSPASGTTDSAGRFATVVTGVVGGIGTATVTANAVGSTAAATVTVSLSATTFAISQTRLNAAAPILNPAAVSMTTADSLLVTVAAPAPSTSVTFATSVGTWNGAVLTSVNVLVAGGTASATLTTTNAGVASVQVIDPINTTLSDSLLVSMTAVTPAIITLQASPSVVPKSVGTTTGTSTLIATVTDANGQPVGNAPVAFSILNPTGGGETVSPVVAYTTVTAGGGLTLGQARTSFTSGSLTSDQTGVQVRATVLGTTVQTEAAGVNATLSGNDAAIIIGGLAGSVAWGSATVLGVNSNATAYILAMSVLVADANGSPAPLGTVVNLSLWPIAWSTGGGCLRDTDDTTGRRGTFLNEDANENVSLDALEDGTRKYYASGSTTTTSFTCTIATPPVCTSGPPVTSQAGTIDTRITPPNSAAGTVTSTNPLDAPGTVTTDASGVGNFNLTYGKNSAIWTVVRIRGRTVVAGSDAVGEIQFRLAPLKADAEPCILPPSPYTF